MRAHRRLPLALLVTLALFISATLGMSAYSLWLLRSDAIKNGLAISALLARSFEDHLTQSIHAVELAGVNSVSSGGVELNLRHTEKDFVSILRNSPYIRSMSLLDETDHIIASSNSGNLGIAVTTKDYFPIATGVQSFFRNWPALARARLCGWTCIK